jgi:hypothetical protein
MTLLAGNYEWTFELITSGSIVKSIKGLADAHITYKTTGCGYKTTTS